MLRTSGVGILSILTILYCYVSAQSPPVCLPGFDWTFNSLKQSPCFMAVELGGACNNGVFTLSPLQPDFVYVGTTELNAGNTCKCSSVYYSVLSACALCQNASWLDWSIYITNCSVAYLEVFKEQIPQGTTIPHYAYLNVTEGNTFDAILAQNAGGPESTPVSRATQSPATGTGTPTSAPKNKKLNTGAIAGGVVGGVAVIVLACLAACFFITRRRKRFATANPQYQPPTGPYGPGLSPNNMMKYTSGIPPSMGSGEKPLYNPNDPSTFPSGNNHPSGPGYNPYSALPELNTQGVGSPNYIQQSFTGNTNTTLVSSPAPAPRTQYTGIPEL